MDDRGGIEAGWWRHRGDQKWQAIEYLDYALKVRRFTNALSGSQSQAAEQRVESAASAGTESLGRSLKGISISRRAPKSKGHVESQKRAPALLQAEEQLRSANNWGSPVGLFEWQQREASIPKVKHSEKGKIGSRRVAKGGVAGCAQARKVKIRFALQCHKRPARYQTLTTIRGVVPMKPLAFKVPDC